MPDASVKGGFKPGASVKGVSSQKTSMGMEGSWCSCIRGAKSPGRARKGRGKNGERISGQGAGISTFGAQSKVTRQGEEMKRK